MLLYLLLFDIGLIVLLLLFFHLFSYHSGDDVEGDEEVDEEGED